MMEVPSLHAPSTLTKLLQTSPHLKTELSGLDYDHMTANHSGHVMAKGF